MCSNGNIGKHAYVGILVIIILTYNYLRIIQDQELPNRYSKFIKPIEQYKSHQSKIWISMAICWGQKANFYGKEMFPYALASTLSTKLWLTIFPTAKSI